MSYISDKIKKLVHQRALGCCEYCLLHEDTTFLMHEMEHIISLKHGGTDEIINLALVCSYCIDDN